MSYSYKFAPYEDPTDSEPDWEWIPEDEEELAELWASKMVDAPQEKHEIETEQTQPQKKPSYGEIVTVDDAQPYYKLDFVLPGLARGDVGILAGSGWYREIIFGSATGSQYCLWHTFL